MAELQLQSERVRVRDTAEAVNQLAYARGWSDGLPIIPPTEERVLRMLSGTRRRPDYVIGKIPPKWGRATVEKVAINAVMAGCQPSYLPIVLTALEAMLEESFNLYGIQATTYPAVPLVIVNGPIIQELGLNSGYGVFGPGCWANATIGRAIRLVLMNIGGAIPGKLDRDTHAHPGKYTFCIAENEEANPWEPLHVERGFERNTSTVTVKSCEGPHNINDHQGSTAEHILTVAADTMATLGMNQASRPAYGGILVLCPEHAATIAREGWSKDDVKRFVFEHARMPLRRAKLSGGYDARIWPRWFESCDDNAMIPLFTDWREVVVIVAGGAGKHSCCLPGGAGGGGNTITMAIIP